jgi:hypothetical protein
VTIDLFQIVYAAIDREMEYASGGGSIVGPGSGVRRSYEVSDTPGGGVPIC